MSGRQSDPKSIASRESQVSEEAVAKSERREGQSST